MSTHLHWQLQGLMSLLFSKIIKWLVPHKLCNPFMHYLVFHWSQVLHEIDQRMQRQVTVVVSPVACGSRPIAYRRMHVLLLTPYSCSNGTRFIGRSTADRLATVIAESWRVAEVNMDVWKMEDSIHRRSSLDMELTWKYLKIQHHTHLWIGDWNNWGFVFGNTYVPFLMPWVIGISTRGA